LQRGTSLIPKSSNVNRIVENLDILSFELSTEEVLVISSLNRNKRFNDPGIYTKFMGANIPIFA
jgi:diketogulonate reductase-like aldo/keto reductase